MSNELYRITDGTTTINLINGLNLIQADPDAFLRPALPPWKGGGTWQSSPLSDGRRLVNRQFGNINDTHAIKLGYASGTTQDQIVYALQELFRLLEKAVQYWVTDWQNEPVWIEARSSCETNIRYALVQAWDLPNLDDPYRPPFDVISELVAMDELVLGLEHTFWMAYAPGNEPCVELSGKQNRWPTNGSDTAAPAAAADDGYIDVTTGDIGTGLASTTLIIGKSGKMFFFSIETTFTNQNGDVVAKLRKSVIAR